MIGQFANEEMQFHNISVAKNVIVPPVYLIPEVSNI